MRFIKDYISPLMKWWWLIIAAPLIAAVSAYLFARQLPPVYQAKTTLLIGRAIQDPNPSGNEFSMSYQLATEYANMATREPVRNAAKAALGLTELPEYEATARGIFLELAVIHTDPRFAQAVANVLAQQLILLSPVNTQQTSGTDQQFVATQLQELQKNIEETRQEISSKQSSLSNFDSALDIAKTQNELKALEDKMSTLQGIYSELFASTREAAFNTLSVFDTASLPTEPIGPRKLLIVLLAAVSGLAFTVGAAYLIEFLDDTIKTTDEISRLIDLPAIGYIGEMHGFKPTFVASNPRSPEADSFRGLRTNLEFMAVDRPMKKLAISSAEASDGKSTIAINLAIVIAQSEKKVILVDADLRSPSIYRYLGVPENPGLSDVFLERVKVKEALVEWDGTPKFQIMSAGATPPNSAELLGSRKMDQILEELAGMADIVIIDGPPGFVVDAIVLSAKVDGVLLVVNIGETRRGSIKAVIEQFERVGANMVGLVLNRVSKGSGYYGSYYYASYYSKEPVTRPIPSTTSPKKKVNLKFNPRKYFSRLMDRRKMPADDEVNRVLKKVSQGDQLAPLDATIQEPEAGGAKQPSAERTLAGVVQAAGDVADKEKGAEVRAVEVMEQTALQAAEAVQEAEAEAATPKKPVKKKARPKQAEKAVSVQPDGHKAEGAVGGNLEEIAGEASEPAHLEPAAPQAVEAVLEAEAESQVEAVTEMTEEAILPAAATETQGTDQPETKKNPRRRSKSRSSRA